MICLKVEVETSAFFCFKWKAIATVLLAFQQKYIEKLSVDF